MNDIAPASLADSQQRRAAHPGASVWVSASAGTGKTKVLTDRVLALLLAETEPHKILCLTFTKAAAAEMANRVAKRLGAWVTLDDDTLNGEIKALLDAPADQATRDKARRLFAQVLDVPGGMKIQTIHAFCQSVLRRFPLEAGIAPHFDLLDDQDANDLLATVRDTVVAHAFGGGDKTLARALGVITARISEYNFPDLMRDLTADRAKLAEMIDRHGGREAAINAVYAKLGVTPTDTETSLTLAACADGAFDANGLKQAAATLSQSSKTDMERGVVIASWLTKDAESRATHVADYALAYLTQAGTVRAKLATKAVAEDAPACVDILNAEADRLLALMETLKAVRTAEATAALITLGGAFLDRYRTRKEAMARLDYDDLIEKTRHLLERPGVAAWVLYKLDGGLDHILIDEAQDTNPDQWAVVRALTEEFFAGEGRHEDREDAARTVFAVGDRKQSIYSFQGADPDAFEHMRGHFSTAATNAARRWEDIALQVSFRSTTAVLGAVDAVFKLDAASEGVVLDGEDITHLSAREKQAGLVELWPLAEPDAADSPPPWKPPVERVQGGSPSSRLARLIAAHIENMVGRDLLAAKGRTVQAGDVMVLVQRRTDFIDDLVRELKKRDIAVAGVDRMVLIEQMAVMDLIALGRVLLLPEDDLTLATVLKGPLVGLSEDDLFALSHGRGDKTLWAALGGYAGSAGVFGRAHALLEDLLARADFMPPFELFGHVLVGLDGRRKLLARLGMDADDPIDEFLAQAIAYQGRHTPSLEGFLHWLEHGGIEVKRDLEQDGQDAVRIMTAHGAKGLQAPIVYLPDTARKPAHVPRLVWEETDDGPLLFWPPTVADLSADTATVRDRLKILRDQEYRRLLYVAMTRAEDRLYVCGWQGSREPAEDSWYHLIRAALEADGETVTETDGFLVADGTLPTGEVLRRRSQQEEPATPEPPPRDTVPAIGGRPAFADMPPTAEPAPPKPLAPSRPEIDDPPVSRPLGADQNQRYQRGLLIHRLLQSLPELPPERRADAAHAYLSRPAWELDRETREAMVIETLAVLEHPDLASLFGPGSRAEVPVAGLIDGHVISGQVDRLVVTDEDVLIVDYKTNRPPPTEVENVSPAYLFQMAAYRKALRIIYPDRPVRCVLVWTDGPSAMELPAKAMDTTLP